MSKLIYSKTLEEKLSNLDLKYIIQIYKSCIVKTIPIELSHVFETVVKKGYTTYDNAFIEIAIQAKCYANNLFQDYPFYYFESKANNEYYSRIYMLSPNEDILLNMFTDKIMVLL